MFKKNFSYLIKLIQQPVTLLLITACYLLGFAVWSWLLFILGSNFNDPKIFENLYFAERLDKNLVHATILTPHPIYLVYTFSYFVSASILLFLAAKSIKNFLALFHTTNKKIDQKPKKMLNTSQRIKFLLWVNRTKGIISSVYIKIINRLKRIKLQTIATIVKTIDYQRFLFLSGALVINVLAVYESQKNNFSLHSTTAIWLWLLSIIPLIVYFWDIPFSIQKIKRTIFTIVSTTEGKFIAISTLLFGILAGFNLEYIPYAIHHDEIFCTLTAQKIIDGTITNPFITTAFTDVPSFPLFYLYPMALGIKLIASPIIGLRLPGIVFSTVAIPLLYILVKKLFSQPIAIVTVLLVITSPVILHLSKVALGFYTTFFFILLCLLLLYLSLIHQRKIYYVLLGSCSGIAFYTYFASRIIPLVIFGLLLVFENKKNIRYFLKKILLVGFVFSLTTSPLLYYAYKNPTRFLDRSVSVSIFTPASTATTWRNQTFLESDPYNFTNQQDYAPDPYHLQFLWYQIKHSFLAPLQSSDQNNHFGFDHTLILNPLLQLFFLVGLVIFLKNLKQFPYFAVFVIVFFTIFLGSTLTIDTPTYNRYVGIFPFFYLISAVGLWYVFNTIQVKNSVKITAGVIFLILVLLMNLGNYFVVYNELDCGYRNSKPVTYLARMMKEQNSYHYYFINVPSYNFERPVINFLAGENTYTDLPTYDHTALKTNQNMAFVFFPKDKTLIDTLTADFPQGMLEEQHCPANNKIIWYYVYYVNTTS